jgi:hypothetical protein
MRSPETIVLDSLLSLADAAEVLGISPATLRHQAAAGRLHGRVMGKTWITTVAEVERYRAESLGRPGRKASPPSLGPLGEAWARDAMTRAKHAR